MISYHDEHVTLFSYHDARYIVFLSRCTFVVCLRRVRFGLCTFYIAVPQLGLFIHCLLMVIHCIECCVLRNWFLLSHGGFMINHSISPRPRAPCFFCLTSMHLVWIVYICCRTAFLFLLCWRPSCYFYICCSTESCVLAFCAVVCRAVCWVFRVLCGANRPRPAYLPSSLGCKQCPVGRGKEMLCSP